MSAPDIWLPLGDLKQELRIPEHANDSDTLLGRHIVAAVGFLEAELSLPLTDRVLVRRCFGSGLTTLDLGLVSHSFGVASVTYWTDEEARRADAPDGMVDNYGRLDTRPESGTTRLCLYPPMMGWPPAHQSEFVVGINQGLDASRHPAVTQALILICRQWFEGREMITGTQAWERLTAPLAYLGSPAS